MPGYPEYQVDRLGSNQYRITISGESHIIEVQHEGKAMNAFRELKGETAGVGQQPVVLEEWQTCYGHPTLEDQGPDIPPASVISLIKGPKTKNIHWAGYWRGEQARRY